MVKRILTGKWKKYYSGNGSDWVCTFENDLLAKRFDEELYIFNNCLEIADPTLKHSN